MQYWHLSTADQEAIIDQLIHEKFIDEARFAQAYVKDKFVFNKWGKYKISFQLKLKKVPQNLIEDALNQIEEESYKTTIQELAQSKLKQIKGKTSYEKKAKLVRFLVQRGFEMEAVNDAISEFQFCN